jgi:hypothetical protein
MSYIVRTFQKHVFISVLIVLRTSLFVLVQRPRCFHYYQSKRCSSTSIALFHVLFFSVNMFYCTS